MTTMVMAPNPALFAPAASRELALSIDELESLDALGINWGDFFGGVGVGIGLVGLFAAGLAIT